MISIIIPAYRADATLKKCLKSIENQSYKDYEVIVIKDVLGASKARNRGIQKATGEFIFFLDADDILAEDALMKLSWEQADLVVSGYDPSTVMDYLKSPNKNIAFAFCWGKLFKTEIIKKHGIWFKGIEKHEDTEFIFNYLRYARTIKFIKDKTVIHIQPETGKGMEVFDASFDRAVLMTTLRQLIDDKALLDNCWKVLARVDAVRACRKFNILHPILSLKARKRYTPHIIFGTGSTARSLYEQCQKRGIRVDCFCDEAEKFTFCGLRVLNPQELKVLFPSARIMITTSNIKDVLARLKALGFKNFLFRKTAGLLSKVKLNGYARFCLENCIDANKNWNNESWLRSLDLLITERCTLKCRDCSNLMQYYKNPRDININYVAENLNEILQNYSVGEIRVIGGEPFLHKDYPRLISRLVADSRIKRIVIYTNGTIVPQASCLKSQKVFVMVTRYKDFAAKIPHIERVFNLFGVSYEIQNPIWTDCGKVEKRNRTDAELAKIYSECCSKNITLSNGRLHKCAFAANLARLDLGYGDPCDYCNGRPLNAKTIIPAIQKR